MLKLADNHWGRWVDTIAARLRPATSVTTADEPGTGTAEAATCQHCGHTLPAEISFSPRCTLCGDGDSSLALYSQHALHRTAFAVRH